MRMSIGFPSVVLVVSDGEEDILPDGFYIVVDGIFLTVGGVYLKV